MGIINWRTRVIHLLSSLQIKWCPSKTRMAGLANNLLPRAKLLPRLIVRCSNCTMRIYYFKFRNVPNSKKLMLQGLLHRNMESIFVANFIKLLKNHFTRINENADIDEMIFSNLFE